MRSGEGPHGLRSSRRPGRNPGDRDQLGEPAPARRRRAVRTHRRPPPLVMCHISHVYPAGASLYYTVACAQAPDPIAQRATAKPPPATTSPPPAAQSPTITRSAPTTVTG